MKSNLVIILCFLFIVLIYLFRKLDKFYRHYCRILFLDREETISLLTRNDKFYGKFHQNDLVARRVQSVNEYKRRVIVQCGCTPSLYEKVKLAWAIREADRRISKINENWFDGRKAKMMKWKIACTKGTDYENGYPHTINDTIVISKEIVNEYSMKDLVDTLIHEKTHIYQKKFREDVKRYIDENQFEVLKTREADDNIRTNPDIDDMIYIHQPSGDVYKLTYKDRPKTISDTIEKELEKEHPYEEMAIRVERM